ncbi:hypothetical protein [Sphingopyxis sp. KK2]|uniref:hypothetical protein n=2 Tax=Sphingomonadaceae TaxID=41297 RepID=UPI0015C3D2B7|nr:hypothetical protein [Sphingopyxis sp. KK2]
MLTGERTWHAKVAEAERLSLLAGYPHNWRRIVAERRPLLLLPSPRPRAPRNAVMRRKLRRQTKINPGDCRQLSRSAKGLSNQNPQPMEIIMSVKGQIKEAAGYVKEEAFENGDSPEAKRKAQEGRDLRNEGRIEDGKPPKTGTPGTEN